MIAPQNIQILDLLLGANAVQGKAKTEQAMDGTSQVPFIDVLGLFINPEQSTTGINPDQTDDGKMVASGASDLIDDINSLEIDSAPAVIVAPDIETQQGDEVDSNSKGIKSGLPFVGSPIVDMSKIQQLIDMVTGEQVTGKFDVISADVVDGRLELAVTPIENEDGSEIIKISLPADKLLTKETKENVAMSASGSKSSRISMMSQSQSDDNRLDDLFKKLNLKEIDIDIVKSEESGNIAGQSDKAQVALLGGEDKVAIAVAILPRKELKMFSHPKKGERQNLDINIQPETVDGESEYALSGQSKNQSNNVVPANVRYTGHNLDGLLQQKENILQGFDFTSNLSTTVEAKNGLELPGEMKSFGKGETIYSSVRLNLPQEALSNLKQGGKTVMLRIDPEHLGPARLSLTMNNHMLSARVSVQSMQAKTVIEHSLDQLTDQLNRAGIKVDSIQVNVAGGNAQEHLPDRRPEWRPVRKYHSLNSENEKEDHQVRSIAPAIFHGRSEYITGDSLNLLA